MYYKQRKMEAENQQFVHRVGQLPIVKAVSDKTVSFYGAAKNSNRLFNATLQLAEDSVKKASEIEVVKKVFDNQLISIANGVAVKGLDKVEQSYPIVKKTPKELFQMGKDYYEHSRIKNNVDKIYSAKDYGVTKITDTKNYYENLIARILDNVLSYSDSVVDKYVAVNAEANGQIPHCDANTTYYSRVTCISGKAYYGLKYRAGEKYDVTKQYILQTLGDLHVAMLLVEYTKNSAAWANEKTRSVLTIAQQQAQALWHEINRRAELATARSESIVLHLLQSTASAVAAISQQMIKYSSPYLPEHMEKTVAIGANYAVELRDQFLKAKSLSELSQEVLTEAKEKFGYVQDGLTKGTEYLAELPPVSWLIPDNLKPQQEKDEKTENGFPPLNSSMDGQDNHE